MATRIEPAVYAQLEEKVAGLRYYHPPVCAIAPAAVEPQYSGTIGILSAGTADLSVAEEAAVTAELSGFRVQRSGMWAFGIHRLLSNRHVIAAAVLIVVAGMEGALPVWLQVADCSDCGSHQYWLWREFWWASTPLDNAQLLRTGVGGE